MRTPLQANGGRWCVYNCSIQINVAMLNGMCRTKERVGRTWNSQGWRRKTKHKKKMVLGLLVIRPQQHRWYCLMLAPCTRNTPTRFYVCVVCTSVNALAILFNIYTVNIYTHIYVCECDFRVFICVTWFSSAAECISTCSVRELDARIFGVSVYLVS